MKISLFLGVAVFFFGLISQAESLSFSLEKTKISESGGEFHFVAPPGHHFNSEAPNKVQVKGVDADKISIDGTTLTAIWAKTQDFCQGVAATLYVCDDQNTYCVPLRRVFSCGPSENFVPQGAAALAAGAGNGSGALTPAPDAPEGAKKDSLFIVNDPQKALDQAKQEHKPIMIDFFAIWCPPCNELDEEVFEMPDFEKMAPKFVLLKMDVDSPASWAMKSKYSITGYPTVVWSNESGEETARIIGFRGHASFIATMRHVLAGKGKSFEQNKLAADQDHDGKAAYEVGLTYLDREDYASANYYLYKASRGWSLADIRRNKFLSSVLGMHADAQTRDEKKVYEQFLLSSLEWYPRQPEVFDRASDLAKVAEDLGDKQILDKAHDVILTTTQWYLSHPRARAQTDFSRGDLYETLGDTYESMGDKEKTKDAYTKGADEYLKEITKAKLDPETERGFNLERVFCLWKSGQTAEAERLYSKLEKIYPSEFTFYYQHGRMLQDLKDFKNADSEAQKALQFSYGDNKLRATDLLAEVYQSEGEKKKALNVLNDTLNHFQLPADKGSRSHRYYDKLVALRKTIGGK